MYKNFALYNITVFGIVHCTLYSLQFCDLLLNVLNEIGKLNFFYGKRVNSASYEKISVTIEN
jgi:hypothetical protein